jgi:hypothetical protein
MKEVLKKGSASEDDGHMSKGHTHNSSLEGALLIKSGKA